MLLAVAGASAGALVEVEVRASADLLDQSQALPEEVAMAEAVVVAPVGVGVGAVEAEAAAVVEVAQVVASPSSVVAVSPSSAVEEVVLPPRLCCNGSCNCKVDPAGSRCSTKPRNDDSGTPHAASRFPWQGMPQLRLPGHS